MSNTKKLEVGVAPETVQMGQALAPADGLPTPSAIVMEAGSIYEQVAQYVSEADGLEITPATYEHGLALCVLLKKAERAIEKARREKSGPFDRAAKSINAVYKRVLDAIVPVRSKLERTCSHYYVESLRKKDEQVEAQRKAEHDAASSGLLVKPRPVAQSTAKRVSTEAGVASVGKGRWTYEITDLKKLAAAVGKGKAPDTFVTPNRKMIMAQCHADVEVLGKPREVPGVRFYRDAGVRVTGA
jgi:hypothetical protein